jgi:hypothetical protein
MSSISNGLYFLTLPLVSVMRVIYTSKGMSKKFKVRVIHYVRVIYRKIWYIALPVKFTTFFVRPLVVQEKSFLRLPKNEK